MSNPIQPLLPGASLGVVGGGQLGRYFVLEARRLGYNTFVLDPDANAPAMQVCANPIVATYDDETALATLADACDAVTIEFENVPAASLELIERTTRIAPPVNAVSVAQDRHAEKQTAIAHGLRPVPYALLQAGADVASAVADIQFPAILKTSRLGYDGKGQRTCHSVDEVTNAFNDLEQVDCVLEQRIDLKAEVSVVLARGFDGNAVCFPVAENTHVNGILDTSVVPASVSSAITDKAKAMAVDFANGLEYVGVLAVEFFVTQTDELLFNEMAPRPHNSGHYTLDATVSSQFEQQLRALCALPFASTRLLTPVCMLNVLGDSWPENAEPNFSAVAAMSEAHLHLYGKAAARPGRKMGHINCLAETSDGALAAASQLKSALQTT